MRIGDATLSQRAIFWGGEGDQWYLRNRDAPFRPEIVAPLLRLDLPKEPTIIEIGCGDGFYISLLQKSFNAHAIGLDVSDMAIKAAKEAHPNVHFIRSSAHYVNAHTADLIVFGFCLYVVDRDYLFDLVSRTDITLNQGGYLAIHDFDPPYPQKVPYHHKEGIFTYKMDYSKLWLANPAYEFVSKTRTREGEAITILQKRDWDKWQ
jgi:trans-aconitate methyltransferase